MHNPRPNTAARKSPNIVSRLLGAWLSDVHFTELIRKGATALLLRVGGAGLVFLLTVYLARLLGATDYGLFMLSLTVVMILSVVVRMGLDNVLVRHISTAIERSDLPLVRGYFQTAIRLVLIVGLVATILGILVSPMVADTVFNKPELAQPLNVMMWLLLPFSITFLIAEALKGLKQVADSTIAQAMLIPAFSLVVLVVGGWWFAWSLLDAIAVYVTSVFVAALYAWQRWRSRIPRGEVVRLRPSGLLRRGFPLLLATSGGLVMSWADILVLGVYESADTVGIYAVASKTALLTSLILVAVNSIAAPKFAAFYASNSLNAMAKLARQATLLMTGLVLFPTAVLLLWPEWVLKLFGTEYATGATALMILAMGQLINVACGSVGYLLMMSGHEKIVRNIMLTTAVINVVLNVLLVQQYGIEGVAVATAVSIALWNIWMLIAVRKYLGFWTININPRMSQNNKKPG